MRYTRLKAPAIILAVVALVVGVSSGAVAAKLITGKDIKNGSITAQDIKKGSLTNDRIKKGTLTNDRLKDSTVTGAKVKDGSLGANDLSSAAKNSLKTTYSGPNWSIVDRNVIGNGDSFLRSGPTSNFVNTDVHPPFGVGSLGIRTGSGTDKASFGDQVDFQGVDFSTITAVDYWAFTTAENIAAGGGAVNLPAVQFEINPNLNATPSSFSTAGFIPDAGSNNAGWNDINAVTSGQWFLTGAAGTATGCNQTTTCTWAALQTALNDGGNPATIFTVQFDKGRDFAYSGAVDGLLVNDDLFDFEPFGVTVTHP
jgi:hypothetical protein